MKSSSSMGATDENIIEPPSETMRIKNYYNGKEGLWERYSQSLKSVGIDLTSGLVKASDLFPFDQFHAGGDKATEALVEQMAINEKSNILDLGSGIGGPSRWIQSKFGCRVHGVDLAPQYVEVSKNLSKVLGLWERLTYQCGDITRLATLQEAQFDSAVTLHVSMNIKSKSEFYREVFRVLNAGGEFGFFDVIRGTGAEPIYPTPWAGSSDDSFLESEDEKRENLLAAGFGIKTWINMTSLGLAWIEAAMDQGKKAALAGRAPAGVAVLLGQSSQMVIPNFFKNLKEDRCSILLGVATKNN